MKNFFRHWHYGIKAKVIDNAIVADIDTAIEPTLLRLDLSRLQAVGFEVQIRNNVYELMLVGVGAPAATTALAKFEVREAADEACACLKCALLRGERTTWFCNALKATLGVMAAIALAGALSLLFGGHATDDATMGLMSEMNRATGVAGAIAPAHQAGVPETADQFLNSQQ